MPRLDVAVITRDGDAEIVNAARPAALVAFSDAHEGKLMPETTREIAWLVHRTLGVEEPLEEWLETLEEISADDADVRLARRIIAGDEIARRIVLGEIAPDDDAENAKLAEESVSVNGPDPTPPLPVGTPGGGGP
jgi:hypothetical protein